MIKERRETWQDGILLEGCLYTGTLGNEEMQTWLEYFACRYLRVGKMYDVLLPKDSSNTLR